MLLPGACCAQGSRYMAQHAEGHRNCQRPQITSAAHLIDDAAEPLQRRTVATCAFQRHSAAKHRSVPSLSAGKSSARTGHRWAISWKVRTQSAKSALIRPLPLQSPEAAHCPFVGRSDVTAQSQHSRSRRGRGAAAPQRLPIEFRTPRRPDHSITPRKRRQVERPRGQPTTSAPPMCRPRDLKKCAENLPSCYFHAGC